MNHTALSASAVGNGISPARFDFGEALVLFRQPQSRRGNGGGTRRGQPVWSCTPCTHTGHPTAPRTGPYTLPGTPGYTPACTHRHLCTPKTPHTLPQADMHSPTRAQNSPRTHTQSPGCTQLCVHTPIHTHLYTPVHPCTHMCTPVHAAHLYTPQHTHVHTCT